MNAVLSSSAAAERSLSSEGEGETSRPVEQEMPKARLAIEADAERIKSAVVRLTANSIDGTRRARVRAPAAASIPEVRG